MASLNLLAAIASTTKYSEVDDVTVSIGRKVEAWDQGTEKKIKIYDVSPKIDTDVCKYGQYMVDCLSMGHNIDANLANIMLYLAVSMRDPEDISKNLLQKPERGARYHMTLDLPQIREREAVAMSADEASNLAFLKSKGAAVDEKVQDEVNKQNNEASSSAIGGEFTTEEQASFFSFLAGFLMRLQCRQVDNVHGNISSSRDRFKGWYDKGAELFEELNIPKSSLEELKAVMTRKPELTGTWVMWLANTENEKSLNKQPRGLLEYIGLQIYAYQGMHVMTQILAIRELSHAPLGYILRQLDCPITRDGIKEVFNIIQNHEVTTTHPDRKTYFRYARVWGEGYFMKVRSTACAPLLFTAAWVVKEISVNAKSDPTQIYAIQHIGDALRATLKAAAKRLVVALLTNTTVDGESGDMWHTDEGNN